MPDLLKPVLRTCLREPIPEIEEAATLLAEAVDAHLAGLRESARSKLLQSNSPAVREWTESIWGRNSRYSPKTPYQAVNLRSLPKGTRMASPEMQKILHERDGYYCRFCGIPVVRNQVRERLRRLFPDVQIWGRRNAEQHAGLQCMWAQYDHLIPHSRGGETILCNLAVTCAPCNYGRMEYTLGEAGLLNPLERQPRLGPWKGLEALLRS